MQWYNEPAQWQVENGKIHVVAEGKTDFWRTTHYGFIRDNGHFYARQMSGNFRCTVEIQGKYHQQYDQAGLIVWHDTKTWIKSGIEYVNGVQNVSAVVTHNYSDWSVVPLTSNPSALTLQLNRHNDAVEVCYSLDKVQWTMLRLAYLPPALPVQVGMMCAAPDGDGFPVTFSDFTLEATD
jgi:regulation of enolase protein 1 (concanavalin A-like superfamily)